MLTRMDIPGAAATGTGGVPWPLLVVLGIALVLLTGLVTGLLLRRRSTGPPSATAGAGDRDDLARFLDFPPGSGAADPPAGWAVLAPAPAPATGAARPAPRRRRDAVVVLAVMSLTAVLLVGIGAAVAATTGTDGRHEHDGQGVAARLTFGGLVLEPRAVGVTATYPSVEVSGDANRARARVQFPTFNCLSAVAPVDPVAAGCTPSVPEYAELRSPDLVVTRAGSGFRVAGRFPTETRPNGSSPVPTGRVYDLAITVTPADGTAPAGWQAAHGVLQLGSARAESVGDPGVNVLRATS